jgi:predicted CoA-binding protein
MHNKPTLVIGASTKPERYSYLAIQQLVEKKHTTFAFGVKKGTVANVSIETELLHYENLHTITLYINPLIQKMYYQSILELNPKRVVFNPGTENQKLTEMLSAKGIECVEACTLVMLKTNQY